MRTFKPGQAIAELCGVYLLFIICIGVLIGLAGCAHQPLTRSCITQQQYEQLKNSEPPHVRDRLHGKADEDIRPITGSAIELRAWGHALLDTLRVCAGDSK